MKHLVKKRYTVTRPRLLNVSIAQNDGTNRTNCEARSTRSAEKMLNFGNISASGRNKPTAYITQIAPDNNRNQGLKSIAHSSGKSVTGKEMGSTTSSCLNASYLISNFTAKSNDTHSFASDGVQLGNRMSPISDFARSDLLGLNKKLLATLQRMERIQGRINSLESKFKNMNECILTGISTSENVVQPPEREAIIKEWHSSINLSLREHLITKLMNAVFPMMPNTDDRIRIAIETYTRKIEKDIFEAADSKAEYYRLLSERYYTLNKQLDERRAKKKALLQKQN